MHRQILRRTMYIMVWFAVILAMASPVGVPAKAQDGRHLIYADNFDHNLARWTVVTGDYTQLKVGDGVLRLTITDANQAGWVVPNVTVPRNVVVEVELNPVGVPDDGAWNAAILLRASSQNISSTLYHFGINGTGTWEFRRRTKGLESYTDRVRSGKLSSFNAKSVQALSVSAQGDSFTFTVNGEVVGTFEDTSLGTDFSTETYIGLMAGTFQSANRSMVEYSNLRVYETVSETVVGNALLRETFPEANPNKWIVGKNSDSSAEIIANTLVFGVNKPNFMRWSYPTGIVLPGDVDVEVSTAATTATSTQWSYGLGVRGYKNGSELYYYLFEVRGTGRFTFTFQERATVQETLIGATALPNWNQAGEAKLRIVAKGNTFQLYYNNQLVGTAQHSQLSTQTEFFPVLVFSSFNSTDPEKGYFQNLTVHEAQ
ncbi:MAG TPA: hypothetical protein PLD47_09815 [Aggregatilineales bacterium]|nr:hypothetical protein [Anaerolineales bacterium]HRE48009.1 hypothetical protein [Aggregatilineales bacterium]